MDESHEEVQEIVSSAIKLAEQNPVVLSAEVGHTFLLLITYRCTCPVILILCVSCQVIVGLVEEAIKEVEEDLKLSQPPGPL